MRPSHDEYALRIAEVVAYRSTCLRRSVGCVLTNKRNQILSTGYNGRAAGLLHCNEINIIDLPGGLTSSGTGIYPHACRGWNAVSGTNLDACEASHGEQNALLQCRDVYQIETCYVTVSPCITCVKLLLNTSCQRIVFRERYAQDEEAHRIWSTGRPWWVHLPRE